MILLESLLWIYIRVNVEWVRCNPGAVDLVGANILFRRAKERCGSLYLLYRRCRMSCVIGNTSCCPEILLGLWYPLLRRIGNILVVGYLLLSSKQRCLIRVLVDPGVSF